MAAERRTATVTTPSEREIRVERVFDAPRDLVFATMLDPDLVGEWYGPHEGTTEVEVMEPRTETQRFEDLGEQTRLIGTTIFFTREERDGLLSTGMESGTNESFERLDALLAARR